MKMILLVLKILIRPFQAEIIKRIPGNTATFFSVY